MAFLLKFIIITIQSNKDVSADARFQKRRPWYQKARLKHQFHMFKIVLVMFSLSLLYYVAIPFKSTHTSQPTPKYISYLTHSGLNNQRISLENAILTAAILNRTLIIPPLFLGKAVPWKSYIHLKSLLKQRSHQIQTTRRKCIDEVSRRILMNNATNIRDNLYIACRKPSREVTKWSLFVNFNFLDALGISYIEMDNPFEYPNFNISDSTIIKDEELYSYKLFDTTLDQIHNNQFEYHDITVVKDDQLVQEQPYINTPVPITNELQSFYLGKYKFPLELEYVSHFNQSLLQFGSLFGSSRLTLLDKNNLKIQSYIQKSLLFNNPFIHEITRKMRLKLGSHFISIHYRSTEAGFITHRELFMKKLNKELRIYTSFYLQQQQGRVTMDHTMNASTLINAYKQGEYVFKDDTADVVVTPPMPLHHVINLPTAERMQLCQQHQQGWLQELKAVVNNKSNRVFDKDLVHQLPKQLPLVLYIATDVKDVKKDVYLRNIQYKYPCTFYLKDFEETKVLENDPLMMAEIDEKLYKQRKVKNPTGDLLAFGKGHLYYAFVDQLMAGSGTVFYGTEGSTFSGMARHVYLKECENEYTYPLEIIKGYTNQQLWVKNKRRILEKMIGYANKAHLTINKEQLETWLKFVPQAQYLKIIWAFVGCGYMKML